jgi:hypothetical protein
MVAYVVDGSAARLTPGIGRSLATGPGQLGRGGAAASAVWHAAIGIDDQDLVAGFFEDEAGHIDWLKGYLCDPEMDRMVEVLAQPAKDDDEPEELYSRASMNTLEADLEDEYK